MFDLDECHGKLLFLKCVPLYCYCIVWCYAFSYLKYKNTIIYGRISDGCYLAYTGFHKKDTHFKINITFRLKKINGSRKQRFVHLSLLNLC